MEFAFQSAKALSIAAFLFYGLVCLLFEGRSGEFERFGLARLCKLIGGLKVAGALGLGAGYFLPSLVVAASGGACSCSWGCSPGSALRRSGTPC